METLRNVCFYIGIGGTVVAGAIGLAGVWIPNFWHNDIGGKLLLTDVIVTVTAIVACTILSGVK